MDHRKAIANLSAADRLRLTKKSDRHGLVHLALHFTAIAVLAVAVGTSVAFWPVLILPLGVLINFLFMLNHEAIHRTAFRSVWLNDAATRICSLLLVLPADWFRYFHLAHHRFTQEPGRDPELAIPKPGTVAQYVVYISGLPVWSGALRLLARNAAGGCRDAFVPERGRARVRREARVMLAVYAVLAGGSVGLGTDLLLWIWILPSLVGQPFLRLYLLAEHGRCAFVADMFENSRTTFTNRLVRWQHHAYPVVPFHRLPDLHEIVRDHLKETEQGYARFTGKYVAALGDQPVRN